jgi:hypothetical protein
MNHRRIPLAVGIVAIVWCAAGCAREPAAPVASPHLIIDFAISDDAVREVDTLPRFESLAIVAPRFTPPPRPVAVTSQRTVAAQSRLRSH